MAEVRQIREEDAAALLQLQHQLDRETHFMMLEPGERTTTVAGLAERIRSGLASGQELLLEAWARQAGVRRLELTVMVHNRAGLGLYTKLGFLVEGLKRRSLCVDGAWVDEYHMGKLLD